MKKLLITNLLTAFLVALLIGTTAFGATVLFPSGGGTGTNTKPAKGSLLIGASSTAYGVLATSTNDYVLTLDSTQTLGVKWAASAGGGITSLNGLTGSSQTFVNDTNIGITSTSTTHTIGWIGTLGDSRITSAATWNAKQDALGFTPLNAASNLSDLASTSTARTNIGFTGTSPISISGAGVIAFTNPGYLLNTNNLSDLSATSTARTNIGLDTWAGSANITTLGTIATGVWSGTSISNAKIASSTEYLADTKWTGGSTDLVAATGRTSLELGTMATINSPVPIANGGTATTTTPADNQFLVGDTSVYKLKTLTAGTNVTISTSTTAVTINAASGGTSIPTAKYSTIFETIGRFFTTSTNSGTATFNNQGVSIMPGTTSGGSATVDALVSYGSMGLFAGSPTYSAYIHLSDPLIGSGTGHFFVGIGIPTTAPAGITFTVAHIGFKIIKGAGAANLYATQADGTTENASASLTTAADGDRFELLLKVNATSSVDYYWRKNGGALSAATNLTTNLPTSTATFLRTAASNVNTAYQFNFQVGAINYER